MKQDGLKKAAEIAVGQGETDEAFANIPVTPMGPPEGSPPMNEAAGLPIIAADYTPNSFPGEADEDGQADDVLDALFGEDF